MDQPRLLFRIGGYSIRPAICPLFLVGFDGKSLTNGPRITRRDKKQITGNYMHDTVTKYNCQITVYDRTKRIDTIFCTKGSFEIYNAYIIFMKP